MAAALQTQRGAPITHGARRSAVERRGSRGLFAQVKDHFVAVGRALEFDFQGAKDNPAEIGEPGMGTGGQEPDGGHLGFKQRNGSGHQWGVG